MVLGVRRANSALVVKVVCSLLPDWRLNPRLKSPDQLRMPVLPPLGVMPDFDADVCETISLGPGGVICVTSDGIFEAFAPDGEQFGVERLMEILNQGASPEMVIAEIQTAMEKWQASEEPRDDQTVVIAARC